jgi:hypothetical protein
MPRLLKAAPFLVLAFAVGCGGQPTPLIDVATQNQLAKICGVTQFRYYTPSSNQQWDGAPDEFGIDASETDGLKKGKCLRSQLKMRGFNSMDLAVRVGTAKGDVFP